MQTESYDLGGFKLNLGEGERKLTQVNSYFTSKDYLIFRGGGDQSMFILKETFKKMNGFDESFVIMEDFDFIKRARKCKLRNKILNECINVSDRKYKANHYWRVQLANLIAYTMFSLSVSPMKIKWAYSKLLI